jgi:hypothetical protein
MDVNQFWVFFDTATRPEYYQDVHKVLALPPGALVEYDYRDARMGEAAIAAAKRDFRDVPKQVLVVYAQWTRFSRGDADPEGIKPVDEMRFQALRRGTLVALWWEGQRAYFQFRLGDHPRAEASLLDPIVEGLTRRSAIPYNQWVALSDAGSALGQLVPEDPIREWQTTVERLSSRPMQFVDDKFLHFDPPGRNRFWAPAHLRSRYRKGRDHRHALEHQYLVPERSEFSLRISNHERAGANPGGVSAPVAHYQVKVTKDGPLMEPSPSSGPFRRAAQVTINLESRHSAKAEAKVGRVIISSEDALPEVSDGIEFIFALRLAAWKRALGVLMLAVAAATVVAAGVLGTENEISALAAILMGIGAVLLGGVGGFLTTGVWSFKT